MKRSILVVLAATVLATGCGQRGAIAPTAPTFHSQQAVGLAETPSQLETKPAPQAPVVVESPLDRLEADLRDVARHGPVIEGLETLGANLDEEAGFGTQATPESTQAKAVQTALQWASDAEQIYLGWGFKWLTFVGHSRHTFWSQSKKKMLTLDYGFFGTQKAIYETENLAMKYGGIIIRQLLREPSDRHAFNGKEAFRRAKNAGLEAPTNAPIKAILIDVYFVGPTWIFFDYRNQPAMLVDANDGRTISDSRILDILKYLF